MEEKIIDVKFEESLYQTHIIVIYNDNTDEELFSYYQDELNFNKEEFVGLTKHEAICLIKKKAYSDEE